MLQEIFGYDRAHPMLFNSGLFLLFFCIFLAVYSFVSKEKNARIWSIIAFSIFFYYKSSGIYVLLFVATIVFDYFMALQIEKAEGRKRKWLLLFALSSSIGLLGYFKYSGFFGANLDELFGTHFRATNLFLPIGISFYTFQSISYLVDVYKKEIPARKEVQDYLFYMTFFPHLVAGPIVRAKDFLPQLKKQFRISDTAVNEALFRISKGLVKKAVIADYLAQYADIVYAAPASHSGFENLVAMYAYTIQIYCDFSGYSDMAIGLALLLGYRLKENFNSAYLAENITDFWRRWHISLSSWLRDYIYIPLGGNRKGVARQYLFLILTMLIGGLWHGASWKFVVWGGVHGLALAGHKLFVKKFGNKIPATRTIRILSTLLTFHFVAVLWVLFRAQSFSDAFASLSSIVTDFSWSWLAPFVQTRMLLVVILLFGLAVHFAKQEWKEKIFSLFSKSSLFAKAFAFLVLVQLVIQLQGENVQPFIYFQF